jgi:hypothetical protein
MSMSVSDKKGKKLVEKIVMLWEEVGLCYHKGAYRGKFEKETYVISHFKSGYSILRNMRGAEVAKQYMQKLHDEVLQDWTFTLQEWDSEENKDIRSELKVLVDKLQQEIMEVV